MTHRWCIIGPTHPYRGGIARHTTQLAGAAVAHGIELDAVTFRRQYPGWMYRGASDRDPDQLKPDSFTPRYDLDSVDPRSWLSAARTVAEHKPDVLVAAWWHPFFAPMYGTVLRRVHKHSPGTVLVVLCHNVLPHETSAIDRVLARWALRPADGLVVHAGSQRDVARDLLGPVPVLLTPHPTYTVDMLPACEPDGSGGPVNLLFFGLIRRYKGLDVLLRSLPALLRERDVQLTIVGEFWDPIEPYVAIIDELGIGDHVNLRPGYVPESDLRKLIAESDIMVAPYRSATQSGAVEMAFGAGLPVVATDVGGLGDQIADGRDGLVVPPEDDAALAAALVRASEPALLAELTRGARSRSAGRTWDSLVDGIESLATTLSPPSRSKA